MTDAVRVERLRKTFGTARAVDDISFAVPEGEIFGLLGPNGAGKTTTLKCLCTLTKPDRGQLYIAGANVLRSPRLARQRLGYIAQDIALDKMLTGRELLHLQASLYHLPSAQINDRIHQMLNLLDLNDYADRLIGEYSGGLKKRLDLAAGFLHQPQVLVLDEPTVGLDIESRQVVWDFLRSLKAQGTTIVLTSHYLEEVDALADRVAIIDRGCVIACDAPAQLKQQVGGDRITLKLEEFTPVSVAIAAQELLTALPVVQSVIINQIQGNSLNLVVQPQNNVATIVQQALETAGFNVFSLARSRPSLDDVYLAATGKTLMDAELAAAEGRKALPAGKQRRSRKAAA
ncbi:ABC transporter ATP-binding protein [filamentous cyanobacterium LEGE 11480]|uniref:ABC transporter ATP-binding protein n=1 Tax=Romeriopsis navalis LEGE 11480 TaxID=2777977 RepID=A0A928Z2E6_9CYAN|nr:ABC transporter ATP-binding protein [Romeriopsis navalis]MBE9028967.1 ABC transporter ATP-binding protein [Romeriopsis navalis LEGE 11480]